MKGWEIILQANNIHRKASVAILIFDKIDFKVTKTTRQRWTLYSDKRDTTSRKQHFLESICTQSGSTKIYKATTHSIKGRNQSKQS